VSEQEISDGNDISNKNWFKVKFWSIFLIKKEVEEIEKLRRERESVEDSIVPRG
jgi:hypothetical protein